MDVNGPILTKTDDVDSIGFYDIPDDVLLLVFQYLPNADRLVCSTVCRRWRAIVAPVLFRSLVLFDKDWTVLSDYVQGNNEARHDKWTVDFLSFVHSITVICTPYWSNARLLIQSVSNKADLKQKGYIRINDINEENEINKSNKLNIPKIKQNESQMSTNKFTSFKSKRKSRLNSGNGRRKIGFARSISYFKNLKQLRIVPCAIEHPSTMTTTYSPRSTSPFGSPLSSPSLSMEEIPMNKLNAPFNVISSMPPLAPNKHTSNYHPSQRHITGILGDDDICGLVQTLPDLKSITVCADSYQGGITDEGLRYIANKDSIKCLAIFCTASSSISSIVPPVPEVPSNSSYYSDIMSKYMNGNDPSESGSDYDSDHNSDLSSLSSLSSSLSSNNILKAKSYSTIDFNSSSVGSISSSNTSLHGFSNNVLKYDVASPKSISPIGFQYLVNKSKEHILNKICEIDGLNSEEYLSNPDTISGVFNSYSKIILQDPLTFSRLRVLVLELNHDPLFSKQFSISCTTSKQTLSFSNNDYIESKDTNINGLLTTSNSKSFNNSSFFDHLDGNYTDNCNYKENINYKPKYYDSSDDRRLAFTKSSKPYRNAITNIEEVRESFTFTDIRISGSNNNSDYSKHLWDLIKFNPGLETLRIDWANGVDALLESAVHPSHSLVNLVDLKICNCRSLFLLCILLRNNISTLRRVEISEIDFINQNISSLSSTSSSSFSSSFFDEPEEIENLSERLSIENQSILRTIPNRNSIHDNDIILYPLSLTDIINSLIDFQNNKSYIEHFSIECCQLYSQISNESWKYLSKSLKSLSLSQSSRLASRPSWEDDNIIVNIVKQLTNVKELVIPLSNCISQINVQNNVTTSILSVIKENCHKLQNIRIIGGYKYDDLLDNSLETFFDKRNAIMNSRLVFNSTSVKPGNETLLKDISIPDLPYSKLYENWPQLELIQNIQRLLQHPTCLNDDIIQHIIQSNVCLNNMKEFGILGRSIRKRDIELLLFGMNINNLGKDNFENSPINQRAVALPNIRILGIENGWRKDGIVTQTDIKLWISKHKTLVHVYFLQE